MSIVSEIKQQLEDLEKEMERKKELGLEKEFKNYYEDTKDRLEEQMYIAGLFKIIKDLGINPGAANRSDDDSNN